MTRYKKKMLILAMALIVCAVSILPWTQVAYATPDAEPTKTTIADKLILQLGPNWAGVEFELSTDMGKYPGAIIVGDNGVLTLELADSSTYTLSCLNSRVTPPKPELQESNVQAAESTEGPIYAATDLVQPSEPAPANKNEQHPTADLTKQPQMESETPADEFRQNIPTLQLVLFIGGAVLCIGGAVLCIGGLIVIRIVKKRREYDDEDDE